MRENGDAIGNIEQEHYASWCSEYAESKSFTGMHTEAPPGALLWLLDRYTPSEGKRVLDLGCGAGRVAIYLAERYGCEAYAFDFAPTAIAELDRRAAARHVTIHRQVARLDEPWPYPDGFFDCAIDNTASMSIASAIGRIICRDEMFRTLKSRGVGLVSAICPDDELERSLPPGAEPDTALWQSPSGGPIRIEKLYTPDSLQAFFDEFAILDQAETRKQSIVWGRPWNRHSTRILVQKP